MNSNYEYQKFAAKKRTNDYLQQAELHRQAKKGTSNNEEKGLPFGKAGLILIGSVVVLVIGFLLTGCQPGEITPAAVGSEETAKVSTAPKSRVLAKEEAEHVTSDSSEGRETFTMAERIQFQDRLAAKEDTVRLVLNSKDAQERITMGERIQFQDRLWESQTAAKDQGLTVGSDQPTMAERIRFQDRLQRP